VTRTYLDSGVLIAAARGAGELARRAVSILQDSNREFVSSDYVRLEVLPKPLYFNHKEEVRFYEQYFGIVAQLLRFDVAHLHGAYAEACASGLSALDALHIFVASAGGCDEIVTTEKSSAAIHRTTRIPVVTIDTE